MPDDADDLQLEPAVEALIEGDDDLLDDTARHYQQDPNHLAQFARDADEIEQDDQLDLDQTELAELGSVLDDPHQPEPE